MNHLRSSKSSAAVNLASMSSWMSKSKTGPILPWECRHVVFTPHFSYCPASHLKSMLFNTRRGCCTCSFSRALSDLIKVSSAAAGAKSPICRTCEAWIQSSFQSFQCMSQQKDEILRSRPISEFVHPQAPCQLLQSFCTHQPWRTIAPAGWTS